MVKINRAAQIPTKLSVTGAEETDENVAAFQADPVGFQGAKKFSFDTSIYGHESVKESLKTSQHHKCCFCESVVTHIAYGDVEHFRPKGGFLQNPDENLQTPGYFWLAYEWTNLLFCCQLCNQRFKKNLFPLLNPADRIRMPGGNIQLESPLFIDPADNNMDPEDYIAFRGDTPFAIGGNPQGEVTIEALGLKRENVRSRRAELLEKLKLIYDFANEYPENPFNARVEQLFRKATNPKAEYSVAAKCAFRDGFAFV